MPDRPGLAPLVEGLLDGLGRRFGLTLAVRHERVEAGVPHDRFHLRRGDAPPSRGSRTASLWC